MVYRGQKIPELVGGYLYADYVTGKIWALFYDSAKSQVTANREIPLTPQYRRDVVWREDRTGGSLFHDVLVNHRRRAVFGLSISSRAQ